MTTAICPDVWAHIEAIVDAIAWACVVVVIAWRVL